MVSWLFFILAAPALVVHAARQITVTNRCPSTINVFQNGESQGTLASGSSRTSTVTNNFNGFIYTDANGGSQSGDGTTRAGFFGQSAYYYLVVDPNGFNTAVTITPSQAPSGGFCVPAACSSLTCSTAFKAPPTAFPPTSSSPPTVPLYRCPKTPNNVGFTITFCPSGSFPPPPTEDGVAIHPNRRNNKCLDVRAAQYANGTPVQIYDCNGTGAQKWVINRANTKVRVANTNFCLDAGTTPASGVGMKIWTCYDNLPAQAWYYTNDNRIAVTGKGQCLDLTNGVLTNSNRVQTWQCTDNNNNQVWTL